MTNDYFLRLPQVLNLIGVSKSTLYRLINKGLFPEQIKLCTRIVVWNGTEVQDWLSVTATGKVWVRTK